MSKTNNIKIFPLYPKNFSHIYIFHTSIQSWFIISLLCIGKMEGMVSLCQNRDIFFWCKGENIYIDTPNMYKHKDNKIWTSPKSYTISRLKQTTYLQYLISDITTKHTSERTSIQDWLLRRLPITRRSSSTFTPHIPLHHLTFIAPTI